MFIMFCFMYSLLLTVVSCLAWREKISAMKLSNEPELALSTVKQSQGTVFSFYLLPRYVSMLLSGTCDGCMSLDRVFCCWKLRQLANLCQNLHRFSLS